MKRLDYRRMAQGIDPLLQEFLVRIHEQDTVRRTMTSFPEYFTDASLDCPIPRKLLKMRYASLLDIYGGDTLEMMFKWFGITLIHFVKGEAAANEHPLPADFERKHFEDYDGLSDEKPWIVSLCRKGSTEPEDFFVIQTTDMEEGEYLLSVIPLRYITLDENADI